MSDRAMTEAEREAVRGYLIRIFEDAVPSLMTTLCESVGVDFLDADCSAQVLDAVLGQERAAGRADALQRVRERIEALTEYRDGAMPVTWVAREQVLAALDAIAKDMTGFNPSLEIARIKPKVETTPTEAALVEARDAARIRVMEALSSCELSVGETGTAEEYDDDRTEFDTAITALLAAERALTWHRAMAVVEDLPWRHLRETVGETRVLEREAALTALRRAQEG